MSMDRYVRTSKTSGYVKLRLSPREMKEIRQELETATEESFNQFDEAKRRTWTEARRILL